MWVLFTNLSSIHDPEGFFLHDEDDEGTNAEGVVDEELEKLRALEWILDGMIAIK